MTTNFDIKDKTALVTGANRGIGKVIVEAFLKKRCSKSVCRSEEPGFSKTPA